MLGNLYPMENRKVKFDGKKTAIYNKQFEYLLNNDPEKVFSKLGINIRRVINPLLKTIVPLFSENKIVIEKQSVIPEKIPIIFAPTHGFRDDIPAVIKSIDRHAYLVYASLPHFYYSLESLGLYINGCIMMDRKDQESRRALIPKVVKAFSLGLDVILYPEGVWNKTSNLLVQELYPGIHAIAQETKALVVPIGVYQANGICYVSIEEPINLATYSLKDGKELLRDKMASSVYELMEKYAPRYKRKDLGTYDEIEKEYLDSIILGANGLYDYEIENTAQYKDRKNINEEEAFSHLKTIEINQNNAKALCYRKR